jgi:hypothetical protein
MIKPPLHFLPDAQLVALRYCSQPLLLGYWIFLESFPGDNV